MVADVRNVHCVLKRQYLAALGRDGSHVRVCDTTVPLLAAGLMEDKQGVAILLVLQEQSYDSHFQDSDGISAQTYSRCARPRPQNLLNFLGQFQ